jgi:uncharacterized membrane protein YphA (DoxX/SURF4 family)
MTPSNLNRTYWALRLTYGLVPLLAGLDKFTNLLVKWPKYLSPLVARLVPFSAQAFMGLVGVVEIVVGLGVLLRYPRIGGYVAAAWLGLIAANLVAAGMFDVAVRDLAMAVGAIALATLDRARASAVQITSKTTDAEAPVSAVRRAA